MRDYSAKEIAYYNRMFSVPYVFVPSLDTKVRSTNSGIGSGFSLRSVSCRENQAICFYDECNKGKYQIPEYQALMLQLKRS